MFEDSGSGGLGPVGRVGPVGLEDQGGHGARTAVIEARVYQSRMDMAIAAAFVEGHRRVLAVAPPGSGKTVVYLKWVSRRLARGQRGCIVVPDRNLTQQTINKLRAHPGLPAFGVIWAEALPGDVHPARALQVASAHTLANCLADHDFDFLVTDEAHHAVAPTWGKILAHYAAVAVLGVTASPRRLDGIGLWEAGFRFLVDGPGVGQLIEGGFLSRYLYYAPGDTDFSALDGLPGREDFSPRDMADIPFGELRGNAVREYGRLCPGKRALVYAASVDESKAARDAFAAVGWRAAHMDGNMPMEARVALLEQFRVGDIQIMCSCNVLGEGIDIPGVEAVVLLRPTRSHAVWIQQLGRGLRIDPENSEKVLFIIDCAGNWYRFYSPSVLRLYGEPGLHGEVSISEEDEARAATRHRCASCGLVAEFVDGRCPGPGCGAVYVAPSVVAGGSRTWWRDGDLVLVEGEVKKVETRVCATPPSGVMFSIRTTVPDKPWMVGITSITLEEGRRRAAAADVLFKFGFPPSEAAWRVALGAPAKKRAMKRLEKGKVQTRVYLRSPARRRSGAMFSIRTTVPGKPWSVLISGITLEEGRRRAAAADVLFKFGFPPSESAWRVALGASAEKKAVDVKGLG